MSEETETPQDIVAGAGRYYRNARYVICAMTLGAGLWFGYDGFYNWPKQRDAFNALSPEKQASQHLPQNEKSIQVNQGLALALMPLAPLLLVFFLYRSRGEYRLAGTTLSVPGHPPVPLDAMTAIDKSKWKRKGIAYVDYQLPGGAATGRLTLDDFVYDQIPTDKIVDVLSARLDPQDETETSASGEGEAEVDDSESSDTSEV